MLIRRANVYGVMLVAAALTGCGSSAGDSAAGSDPASSNAVSIAYALSDKSGDNYQPTSIAVIDAQGALYGTTALSGRGSVFKMDGKGVVTIVHQFEYTYGIEPGTLVVATDGTVYGTTNSGGTYGSGTVFKIATDGTWTSLHSFVGPDGFSPDALIIGSDGNLYGATFAGGATYPSSQNASLTGAGVVFKMTPSGDISVVYSFRGSDGYAPVALLQGADGNLYGATTFGGSTYMSAGAGQQSNGTVFKLSMRGTLSTIATFGTYGSTNSLIRGRDGNLYGTTYDGGRKGLGSVFEVTPNGQMTQLHAFSGPDGMNPSGPIQGANGVIYGATSQGGNAGLNFGPFGLGGTGYTGANISQDEDGNLRWNPVEASSPSGRLRQSSGSWGLGLQISGGARVGVAIPIF